MPNVGVIQGELQEQIMIALWRLEAGTVEEVRQALPSRYRPRLTEAEYVSRSIASALAGASSAARQAALVQLIGSLQSDELAELRRLTDGDKASKRQRKR